MPEDNSQTAVCKGMQDSIPAKLAKLAYKIQSVGAVGVKFTAIFNVAPYVEWLKTAADKPLEEVNAKVAAFDTACNDLFYVMNLHQQIMYLDDKVKKAIKEVKELKECKVIIEQKEKNYDDKTKSFSPLMGPYESKTAVETTLANVKTCYIDIAKYVMFGRHKPGCCSKRPADVDKGRAIEHFANVTSTHVQAGEIFAAWAEVEKVLVDLKATVVQVNEKLKVVEDKDKEIDAKLAPYKEQLQKPSLFETELLYFEMNKQLMQLATLDFNKINPILNEIKKFTEYNQAAKEADIAGAAAFQLLLNPPAPEAAAPTPAPPSPSKAAGAKPAVGKLAGALAAAVAKAPAVPVRPFTPCSPYSLKEFIEHGKAPYSPKENAVLMEILNAQMENTTVLCLKGELNLATVQSLCYLMSFLYAVEEVVFNSATISADSIKNLDYLLTHLVNCHKITIQNSTLPPTFYTETKFHGVIHCHELCILEQNLPASVAVHNLFTPSLTSLHLDDCKEGTPEFWNGIIPNLSKSPFLTELSIVNSKLGGAGFVAFLAVVEKLTKLTTVLVMKNEIDNDSLKKLEGHKGISQLRTLDISDNTFNPADAIALGAFAKAAGIENFKTAAVKTAISQAGAAAQGAMAGLAKAVASKGGAALGKKK